MECVVWRDAIEFCEKLSAKDAGAYRLPTEAEWEYACRAGSTGEYCFGDDRVRLGDHAWYNSNSGQATHEVGQKEPNAWGLYDMHGNVYEWCSDRYGDYPADPQIDPTGPTSGSKRVIRGGSWFYGAYDGRAATRKKSRPDHSSRTVGFRVVSSSGR